MAKFKRGDMVRVLKNVNSHNYTVGKVYEAAKLHNDGPSPSWYCTNPETGHAGNVILESELELVLQTRAEKAEHLKTSVLLEKRAALEALKKEVEDLEAKIERYEKFASVEAEAAHLISQIFKTGGDPGAILEVLKTTKVLSGKEDF